MLHLLASSRTPIIDTQAFDSLKAFVNDWSVPQWSMPLFVLLFVGMLVGYRKWTKPAVALGLAVVFTVLYFGAMLVDYNYFDILRKADNVPITIMLFAMGLCLWVAFREAAKNDDLIAAGKPLTDSEKDDKVLVWPDLVYIELICLVLGSAALILWAVALPAPLESFANPAGPPNPSKAPWYFLGLQEMLVYFDPWMAGVILPGMIVVGLIAMPYIDVNPKGNGYYTVKERPFALSVWLFGFLILWVVLIVFGTFLRGPNWNFFGPFEYWDANMQVPLTNVNMSDYFWIWMLDKPLPTSDTYGPAYMFIREVTGIIFIMGWMFVLPVLLAKTVMKKMYAVMGAPRYYIMAVLLIVMALLPLKMVLRWLFNLKYFIALTEFNMNL